MKIDNYTKFLLTLIAFSLSVIAFNQLGLFPKALATNVNKTYGLVPLNANGTIDVNVKSSETIDVNIEDTDMNAFKYAGPLKVVVID
jgi:hypothetical protein